MIKYTLEIVTLLFYLEGFLLISFEIIFGKIKLINFFANQISYGSNKYIKKLSQFILIKGIISDEKIIGKIGVFITLLAFCLDYSYIIYRWTKVNVKINLKMEDI